jgi:hypothetical protein
MLVSRKEDHLSLSLNLLESRVLGYVLDQIAKRYRCRPEELDPKLASTWYSTRGCKTAGMSEEETQEWLAALHEIKSGSLSLLEDWSGQLASRPEEEQERPITLRVKLDDAPALLTALNDQRLLAAATADIGEAEMDLRSFEGMSQLPDHQQNALFQIEFLGLIMAEILEQLSPGIHG